MHEQDAEGAIQLVVLVASHVQDVLRSVVGIDFAEAADLSRRACSCDQA
jgi:hypothetical protein